MGEVQWVAPFLVLALGLVVGSVAVWRVRRAGRGLAGPSTSTAVIRRDLEVRSDTLLRQLRELDDTASKRTPEQLARERYALELDAARTLRDLDAAQASASKAARAAEHPSHAAVAAGGGNRAALRGFLWGTASMAVLGLLMFYVIRSTEVRKEGGQLTGNLPGEERNASRSPSAPDEALTRLQAEVAQAPDDIEARIALARAYLVREELMEVWKETKAVLDRTPGEPRATSYQAIVRLAMGQDEIAVQMLTDTLKKNPDFLEGYVHLATVYSRAGKVKDGEATIERAAKLFPKEAPELRGLWARIRQRTAESASAPGGGGEAAAPPSATADAAAVGAAGRVQGTVDLDPSLKGRASGGVLFVMIRPDGFRAGPPLAAKRIPNPSFPVSFDIGAADSMTGEALPESVLVQARLDADGDPTTRGASDPIAQADHVKLGTTTVGLVLAPKAP